MSSTRGVTQHRTMDDWLKSKAPGAGGGGGRRLSGWKDFKKGVGEIDTWLHTRTLPLTVWRHSFPMLIAVEDKRTKEKVVHVWARPHTCHETEDVLAKLYWRETKGDPSSERTKPPERCGMCKFAEWLWQQSWAWIDSHTWDDVEKVWEERKKGKGRGVDPCAVLFKFVSEADDDENTTVHVGGFCGLFGRDELPDNLGKAMVTAKIRARDAWKESSMVKAKSVMCVVNNDKPDDGVQISEETKELGEKVKEEIGRVLKSLDVDIQRQPYAIRWEYDKTKNMGKQYTATAMMKIKATPRILKLIRSEASPDLSEIVKPYNQQEMRGILERHCRLEKGLVPWDAIFPSKEQEREWAEEDAAVTDDESESGYDAPAGNDDESDDDDDDDDDESESAGEPAEVDDDGEEIVGCDDCKKPMKISAATCPHCGKTYEVEAEAEPEPEPKKPPLRSRAEAAKAKAGAKPEKPAPKAAPPDEDDDDDDDADQSSGVPF